MKRCLIILLLFAACKNGHKEKLLPLAKMKNVVWDLMQADELMASRASLDTHYHPARVRPVIYARIYRQNGVTEDEFLETVHHYEKYPEKDLKMLLDSLIQYGNRVRTSTDSLRPKTFPDSVPKISPTLDSFKKKKRFPS